jgi:hypothetical protein
VFLLLWGGFRFGGHPSGLLLLGMGRVVEGSVGTVGPSGGVELGFDPKRRH